MSRRRCAYPHRACYTNLEIAQPAREDLARAMRAICGTLASAAQIYLGEDRLDGWIAEQWSLRGPEGDDRALVGAHQGERPALHPGGPGTGL